MKQILIKKFIQFVKFSFVGAINTITSLCIYYVMIYFNINYMISTVVSYLGSSIIGYILNRFWVFQVKKTKLFYSMVKYYVVYGTSLLINMGCMYLYIQILGLSEMISPILTLCVTIPFNFVFSKLWTFRDKNKVSTIE